MSGLVQVLWDSVRTRLRAGASPYLPPVDVDPRAGFSQNIHHVDGSGELTHKQPVFMRWASRSFISITQTPHS